MVPKQESNCFNNQNTFMSNKKRDDEKATWLIVGILFTAFLLGIDIFYSSFGLMATAAKWGLGIAHVGILLLWVVVMVKFTDPNFDYLRKWLVWLCVILSLIIGIHHAIAREDEQVIIDAHENSLK